MSGRKALIVQKCAMMFTSKVRMIFSSEVSRRAVPETIPALFTRIDTGPTLFFVSSAIL